MMVCRIFGLLGQTLYITIIVIVLIIKRELKENELS